MPLIKNLSTFIHLTTQLLEANPTTTRISTRYSLPQPETNSKSRKRKRGDARNSSSPAPEASAPAAAEDAVKQHGRLEVTANDTTTGTALWFRSSERSDVSRLLRSMVVFGGVMAGRREVKDVEPVWPPAEGDAVVAKEGAGTKGKEEGVEVKGKEKEKEKEEEGGKAKKKRKKGKR